MHAKSEIHALNGTSVTGLLAIHRQVVSVHTQRVPPDDDDDDVQKRRFEASCLNVLSLQHLPNEIHPRSLTLCPTQFTYRTQLKIHLYKLTAHAGFQVCRRT